MNYKKFNLRIEDESPILFQGILLNIFWDLWVGWQGLGLLALSTLSVDLFDSSHEASSGFFSFTLSLLDVDFAGCIVKLLKFRYTPFFLFISEEHNLLEHMFHHLPILLSSDSLAFPFSPSGHKIVFNPLPVKHFSWSVL